MSTNWTEFRRLAEAVRKDHLAVGLSAGGHNFDHAVCVAGFTEQVAPDSESGILAFVAALCHNADHILARRLGIPYNEIPDGNVAELIEQWLNCAPQLARTDCDRIQRSVRDHTSPNDSRDDPVKVVLCDADRLANLMPTVLIRGGQFHTGLPDIDPVHLVNNPAATYHEPGCVLQDVKYCATKWDPEHPDCDPRWCLVLPRSIAIGRPLFAHLREAISLTVETRHLIGIVPYPFENPPK